MTQDNNKFLTKCNQLSQRLNEILFLKILYFILEKQVKYSNHKVIISVTLNSLREWISLYWLQTLTADAKWMAHANHHFPNSSGRYNGSIHSLAAVH